MSNHFMMTVKKLFTLKVAALCLLAGLQVGCESPAGPELQARNAQIAAEPMGNYYIGRRYHVPKTRFWGYLRKPRQEWNKARLVIMDESVMKTPDRLNEAGEGLIHGYDNNVQYRVYGNYTNDAAYDPNSNLVLPVFRLTGIEVIDRNPGFLFTPKERYSTKYVSLVPEGGVKEEKTEMARGR